MTVKSVELNGSCKLVRVGILLPHFSNFASPEGMIALAQKIEWLGYDSVWVRDNLDYRPTPFDPAGRRFVEPFVALSAVSGATQELGLGAAVMSPFRHPVVAATMARSLFNTSGGRLEVGIGMGGAPRPFEVTSRQHEDRFTRFTATVSALRCQEPWRDQATTDREIRLWYGGALRGSVDRAVRYCEGILPHRCPFDRLDRAIEQVKVSGRSGFLIGSIPLLLYGMSWKDVDRQFPMGGVALTRRIRDMWRLVDQPGRGNGVEGAVIVGQGPECLEQIARFASRNIELLILDMRWSFERIGEIAAKFASDVLPHLTTIEGSEPRTDS